MQMKCLAHEKDKDDSNNQWKCFPMCESNLWQLMISKEDQTTHLDLKWSEKKIMKQRWQTQISSLIGRHKAATLFSLLFSILVAMHR